MNQRQAKTLHPRGPFFSLQTQPRVRADYVIDELLIIANAGGGTRQIGIQGLAGNAGLNANGASIWKSLYQPVSWANSGLLTLSITRFLSWSSSSPRVQISTGRVMLQNSYFTDNIGMAISVSPTTQRVMILGNMLCGNTVSLNAQTTTSTNNQP